MHLVRVDSICFDPHMDYQKKVILYISFLYLLKHFFNLNFIKDILVILILYLLKHFLIYHINQITYKFLQTLFPNSLTVTSKSRKKKKNNTHFTLKSTQIYSFILP